MNPIKQVLYQGTTSVVPQNANYEPGFSPWGMLFAARMIDATTLPNSLRPPCDPVAISQTLVDSPRLFVT